MGSEICWTEWGSGILPIAEGAWSNLSVCTALLRNVYIGLSLGNVTHLLYAFNKVSSLGLFTNVFAYEKQYRWLEKVKQISQLKSRTWTTPQPCNELRTMRSRVRERKGKGKGGNSKGWDGMGWDGMGCRPIDKDSKPAWPKLVVSRFFAKINIYMTTAVGIGRADHATPLHP
jgi:hypothetical protein